MLIASLVWALQVGAPDTLRVAPAAAPAVLDGVADSAEYGPASLRFRGGQGDVTVWAVRSERSVHLAAAIPDSTFYWGDDLVISLDPRGDAAPGPADDEIQWYIRRTLDSSVVYRGRHGRWAPPGDDPDWRLGRERTGEGWELRTAGTARGWTVELRLDAEWLGGDEGRLPAIAFRVYDDAPHGWHAWPAPRPGERATVVEQRPARWAKVAGGSGHREGP